MFVRHDDAGDLIVTSASDLTAASACEFAFLRRVDAKLGRRLEVAPDDDPMLARAARLGDAHEARVLDELRETFGPGMLGEPGGVVEIPRPAAMTPEALGEVAEQTRRALLGQAEVVFQATFFDPEQRAGSASEPRIAFIGFADFLVLRDDGSYEVQDTKLARRAKVTALMQLAAYAEQLERIGIPVAAEAALILGDGARSEHRIADIAPVFRRRRARLHDLLLERVCAVGDDGLRETAAPVAWGAAGVLACGRCEVCGPETERARDPLLVAGMRRTHRDALMASGIRTLDALAAALPRIVDGTVSVDRISQPVLEQLAEQAALQLGAVPGEEPPFRIVDPEALGAIPEPSAGDLFFDFEGDPLYLAPGEPPSWGLDYLFGMVDRDERFTAFWAHDLAAEREALVQFLAFVEDRRRAHPDMHIYHYAAYERTHLLSIAARHGVGEAEVDRLLSEHVLVDLYPVVRGAMRLGSRSYSIKRLEPLYMGSELRDEHGVTTAVQSVTEYAEAAAQLRSDDPAEQAAGRRRLDEIGEYNRYDCVSTRRLRDWLLSIAETAGVAPHRVALSGDAAEEAAAQDRIPGFEPSETAAALARHAERLEGTPERDAIALAASAIDYYARERKSFWWAHFARLVDPVDDWAETRDVLVVDPAESSVESPWEIPPRGRVERRVIRVRGEIAPGSRFREGGELYALYSRPAPFETRGAAPGARGAKLVTIAEVHDDGLTVIERLGAAGERYRVLPIALTPGPPPRVDSQERAIAEWGAEVVRALDAGAMPDGPAMDLLRRVRPRTRDGAGVTTAESPRALAAAGSDLGRAQICAVVDTLLRLERSALAVQGPPGTGKTYLAARVILSLVREHGWVVGVTAQSHAVVENVLSGVAAAGLDPRQIGKAAQRGDEREVPYTRLRSGQQGAFIAEHRAAGRGCVVGGTAWDFSHEQRVERGALDLLVIDEAGQFSLAPTIAVGVAAQRILLLGDPQQLPQVSQGTHPEPVDRSALGWLLGDAETIPPDLGVFLAETRRMRPELAAVVSELSYANRLSAHPSASERSVDAAGPAGLVWHPVVHAGDSTHSHAEADAVVRIARELARGTLREAGRPERALTHADVIVVAAYNAQVECVRDALDAAGLEAVRVGTVDKFQGQEAALAIVTLAASSADDVPRGLEFLLLRNRLNVAISRAQWAAHLVSSPQLGSGLPGTAEGVTALSGYLRLIERATEWPLEPARSSGPSEASETSEPPGECIH